MGTRKDLSPTQYSEKLGFQYASIQSPEFKKKYGQYITPATVSGLAPGSHTYKLTLTGYYDKTGPFIITGDQTTNIDAGQLRLQVIQAGAGSPAGIILMAGLLVGSIYSSIKKPELLKT